MQRRGPPCMEKERKERGDAKVRNGQGISTGAPCPPARSAAIQRSARAGGADIP
jgi:hypothetical protein